MEKDSNWNWLRRAFRLLKGRPEKIQRRNGVKYAEKSGASLAMDVYLPGEYNKGYPLILFVHGGGFSEGRRDDPRYVQFAENLADKGYPVASITYRLTMKGRSFGCDQPAENKIATFRAAAEDIWDATRYLHENARVFGFMAPPPIVLCGSSAGAEAVLHAAYWPEALLPEGFRYAGVIGMAAAIIELEWISGENALPTLLFHGIDDPLVPFGSDSHHYCAPHLPGYLLLYGSKSIALHLKALDKPYYLVEGLVGGHGWADKPMFDHLDIITHFLEDWVAAPGHIQREVTLPWA
ncbi:MAG: alpha/beta hydrolase [Saprospiraceae bacterium]